MAPRVHWTGILRLSLASPVASFRPASDSAEISERTAMPGKPAGRAASGTGAAGLQAEELTPAADAFVIHHIGRKRQLSLRLA
jgi:hypothetical protein